MKLLIFSAIMLFCTVSQAQNISSFTVQTNCPIIITAPTDSCLIFGAASITGNDAILGYLWKQVSGPSASLIVSPGASQSMVRNLKPGIYVYSLTVTTKLGSIQTVSNDQVTVLPPAAPPRKVISVSFKLSNGLWIPSFIFDDGSIQ